MSVPAPPIVTCPQWGAKPPNGRIRTVKAADHSLVHHTAGHHPEIKLPNSESLAELVMYAKQIQHFHQYVREWIDSGHNFLIGRNGTILQGRWGTVNAIQHGRMVESAHCPSHNDAPGVEFEHVHGELPTPRQEKAGIWLYAWIADKLDNRASSLYGHRDFYATECPEELAHLIPKWRLEVARVLNHYGRSGAPHGGVWRAAYAVRSEIRAGGGLTNRPV